VFAEGNVSISGAYSPTLFIGGHDTLFASSNLFVGGQDAINISGNLYTQGYDITQTSGDLFIQGYESSQSSDNLIINGHILIYGSGDLYSQGIDTLTTSGDLSLFIYGSGISTINNLTTLFVNGLEPKPVLSCPALDPTASVQIKDTLISTYQSRIDALINQLGKNILLEFDPIRQSCPNCEFDMIRKQSTGVYKIGGPRPFERGRMCPWCKGRGLLETMVTKCIKCLVEWDIEDDDDEDDFDIAVSENNGIVRLKTFITEADDIVRTRTIVINYDIASQIKLRAKLISGPTPMGLREDRYCISLWELI
jgi:hypothetical protein